MYILMVISFIAIAIATAIYNSPKKKGQRGEKRVAEILMQLSDEYSTYNDVVMTTQRGTTQIDHIVVSKYAVFTIETKNYRGEIWGDDDRDQWKQVIKTDVNYRRNPWKTYTYITKNEFYNPVRQSVGHAMVIKNRLKEFSKLPVVPIVVFVGSADLSGVKTSRHVIYASEILDVIGKYKSTNLGEEELAKVNYIIASRNIREQVDDSEHVRNVYKVQADIQQKIELGICPRCGKPLCERQGQYGRFLGCSGYPNCKYTKSYK